MNQNLMSSLGMQCKTKIGIMRKKYISDLKIDPGESVSGLCEEKN